MMVVTSPELSLAVLIAIPVIVLPLVAYGRSVRALSRQAQDTPRARVGLCQREPRRQVSVMQAFTHERAAAAASPPRSSAPSWRPRRATKARAGLTAHRHLPDLCQRGRRPVVRRPGRAVGRHDRRQAVAVRALCRACRHLDGRALSEVWGELPNACGGAAERLGELLAVQSGDQIAAPIPTPCRSRRAARSPSDDVSFSYPLRPETRALDRRDAFTRRPASGWRWSGRRARARPRSSRCCFASTIPSRAGRDRRRRR